MKKFSIIIPIYNVEKYIDRCLKSVINQSYKNFEVILIDDGSTDKSISIANKYLLDERFTIYHKKNGGQSSARNYGINKANGEYIIFLDSDDYIDIKLLENLEKEVNDNNIDVISYGIYTDDGEIKKTKHHCFTTSNPTNCISKLLDATFVDPAWAYCYRLEFYKNNKFRFEEDRYHEDFGLIPYILIKAESISSIPFYGYYYVIHDNSIMTTNDSEKIIKKIDDTLFLFDQLVDKILNDKSIDQKLENIILSFLANVVICRSKVAPYIDKYIEELKRRNIAVYLMEDNLLRKFKKRLFKFSPKLYINLFVK